MHIEAINNNMIQLTTLHEELLHISQDKTEMIKQGDMEGLSKLLMQERKQLQAIEQAEQERQQVTEQFFNKAGIHAKEQTISAIINTLQNKEEQEQLEQTAANLIKVIVELRTAERLNSELIQQSMQFVQLSLDMMHPAAKNFNYTEDNMKQESTNRSVFDSRA